jgi:hypothetical protein
MVLEFHFLSANAGGKRIVDDNEDSVAVGIGEPLKSFPGRHGNSQGKGNFLYWEKMRFMRILGLEGVCKESLVG